MLTAIHPKLPMRNKQVTRCFYEDKLAFTVFGSPDLPGYLMMERDQIQIHFFQFRNLDPHEKDGQVYIRTDDIDTLYQSLLDRGITNHPNGPLGIKPWRQKEFSVLDPDNNLLTFCQGI